MSQNVWKTAITLLAIFQITQAWELVCYNGSLSNNKSVTYQNSAQLITSGYFNVNLNTIIYAHGYRGSLKTQGADEFLRAYIELFSDGNVCGVNWPTEANPRSVSILGNNPLNYPLAVIGMQKVAGELGQALNILVQNGTNPETVHLIGMSLGAHLVASAARRVENLSRVTGLDPARPGFTGPFPIYERIDKDCADFVTVVHTDMKKYGLPDELGDIDFYPNYVEYEKNGVQPGCPPLIPPNAPLSPADACSHRFSLNLWIDSLKYPCQLLAIEAASGAAWAAGQGDPNKITCIGESVNQSLSGNFYLRTNPQSPYGLGQAGITP